MKSLRFIIAFALLTLPVGAIERTDIGLTGAGLRIEAATVVGATPDSATVLLVGGLSGDDESVGVVTRETRDFEALPQSRRQFRLLAISLANPDRATLQFPPTGVAYRENPESHALWRWIAIQAPDLVLVVGKEDFGLAGALPQNEVAGIGRIPTARIVDTKPGILTSLPKEIAPSDARREIQRRRTRSPRQLADQLAAVYGRDFAQLTYLPGMALIGRMRLGDVAEVDRLAAPYLDGRNTLAGASSLTLAGHMVFAELAERTGNPRYLELARKAADTGFTATGEMKESMPYHDEMSDSVFMAIPILAKTGKLTGDRKYFDMAARHLSFMQKIVLRPDGLYRHSPLTDAAWARGNAFPALGLALTLSDFPKDHPEFGRILAAFRDHMAALARFQTDDGLWREVVDHAGAYSEYSTTAMVATAMLRGIRNGWLDRAVYQPRVDRAWQAILARTAPDGRLMDVCESTNKQRTLADYLRRAAILDRDPRGGGMGLLFATEMAGLN